MNDQSIKTIELSFCKRVVEGRADKCWSARFWSDQLIFSIHRKRRWTTPLQLLVRLVFNYFNALHFIFAGTKEDFGERKIVQTHSSTTSFHKFKQRRKSIATTTDNPNDATIISFITTSWQQPTMKHCQKTSVCGFIHTWIGRKKFYPISLIVSWASRPGMVVANWPRLGNKWRATRLPIPFWTSGPPWPIVHWPWRKDKSHFDPISWTSGEFQML